jgi:hypothetical protein
VKQGAIVQLAVKGSVIDNLLNVINLDPVILTVSNLAAGDPRKAAGAPDFVIQGANVKNAIVNPGMAAGATTFGAGNGLFSFIREVRQANGDIKFGMFGISLGPVLPFLPNQAARAIVTATVIGDPQADIFYDESILTPDVIAMLPDYGVDGSNATPEPATAVLVMLSASMATCFTRRRR